MLFQRQKRNLLSKNMIRNFCNNIKYFEHVTKFDDGYEFEILYDKKRKKFDNIYDAIYFAKLNEKRLLKSFNSIVIKANKKQKNARETFVPNRKKYIGIQMNELKSIVGPLADRVLIYISPTFSRIYMEYFELGSYIMSFDFELLYNHEEVINKLNKNAIYLTTIKSNPEYYRIKGKVVKPKTRSPIVIKEEDLYHAMKEKFDGFDVYYGIMGYTQNSTDSGLILDWDEELPRSVLPISSLINYEAKRPVVKNITRYKVHVKFTPYGSDTANQAFAYVDCLTGDTYTAVKQAINNGWDANRDGVNVTKIEIVPDGEWII